MKISLYLFLSLLLLPGAIAQFNFSKLFHYLFEFDLILHFLQLVVAFITAL